MPWIPPRGFDSVRVSEASPGASLSHGNSASRWMLCTGRGKRPCSYSGKLAVFVFALPYSGCWRSGKVHGSLSPRNVLVASSLAGKGEGDLCLEWILVLALQGCDHGRRVHSRSRARGRAAGGWVFFFSQSPDSSGSSGRWMPCVSTTSWAP